MNSENLEALRRVSLPLADRAAVNMAKWGPQSFATLGLCVCEEAGELAQAILQERHEGGDVDRIRQEAIDLGALCLQVLSNFPPPAHAADARGDLLDAGQTQGEGGGE